MIAKHINEPVGDMGDTLRDKVKNFVSWSFAIVESMNVKNMVQMAIQMKSVNHIFNLPGIFMQLLDICI